MGLSAYKKYGAAAARLGNALRSGTVSHAYIFEGDNNIDKAGFARAFAQALVCRQMPGEGCGICVECRYQRKNISWFVNKKVMVDERCDGEKCQPHIKQFEVGCLLWKQWCGEF